MYTPTDKQAYRAAILNGEQAQDFTEQAKEYAGEHWKELTEEERESIKSEIANDWRRNFTF